MFVEGEKSLSVPSCPIASLLAVRGRTMPFSFFISLSSLLSFLFLSHSLSPSLRRLFRPLSNALSSAISSPRYSRARIAHDDDASSWDRLARLGSTSRRWSVLVRLERFLRNGASLLPRVISTCVVPARSHSLPYLSFSFFAIVSPPFWCTPERVTSRSAIASERNSAGA